MKFVFHYHRGDGEVHPTPATLRLVEGLDYVIAMDCLMDIEAEARALQEDLRQKRP